VKNILGYKFASIFDYHVCSTKEECGKPNFDHENSWYDKLQWNDQISREEYTCTGAGMEVRNADFIGPFRLQDQCRPFNIYY